VQSQVYYWRKAAVQPQTLSEKKSKTLSEKKNQKHLVKKKNQKHLEKKNQLRSGQVVVWAGPGPGLEG
jgi:hypothetical protein